GKSKKGVAAAYGKNWPGGVWEAGSSGGGSGGAVVRAGNEAREMFLVQLPGEEEEGVVEEEEDDEGSLSGEGEETADIKGEVSTTQASQRSCRRRTCQSRTAALSNKLNADGMKHIIESAVVFSLVTKKYSQL
ncbi:hypothetical protein NL108_011806, partial [Boleophthalmus pectinirostris]